jgi:hypothetical protein
MLDDARSSAFQSAVAIGNRKIVARNADAKTITRSPATKNIVTSCLTLLVLGRCSKAMTGIGDICKFNSSSFSSNVGGQSIDCLKMKMLAAGALLRVRFARFKSSWVSTTYCEQLRAGRPRASA